MATSGHDVNCQNRRFRDHHAARKPTEARPVDFESRPRLSAAGMAVSCAAHSFGKTRFSQSTDQAFNVLFPGE